MQEEEEGLMTAFADIGQSLGFYGNDGLTDISDTHRSVPLLGVWGRNQYICDQRLAAYKCASRQHWADGAGLTSIPFTCCELAFCLQLLTRVNTNSAPFTKADAYNNFHNTVIHQNTTLHVYVNMHASDC